MRSRKFLTTLTTAFCLSIMMSCAASTTLTGWRTPAYTGGPFTKILVIGVLHSEHKREKAEKKVAAALEKEVCKAVASSDYLGTDRKLSKEELGNFLRKNGFDGVLYLRIIKRSESYSYVTPDGEFPFDFDPDWYPYYDDGFEVITKGGHFKINETVYIESSLFSLATGKVVWAANSSTTEVVSISQVATSLGICIAQDLVSKGLIL